LALPGNPTAAFVTFLMLGIPLINKMSGLKKVNNKRYKLPINFYYNKKAGRIEYLRVKTVLKNGTLFLNKFSKEGAGILSSVTWADGLAIIDENTTRLKLDDMVDYISFNEILN
jgi:molybdopterin molybdotransferase